MTFYYDYYSKSFSSNNFHLCINIGLDSRSKKSSLGLKFEAHCTTEVFWSLGKIVKYVLGKGSERTL